MQCTEVVRPVSDPSSLEQMNHSRTQMEQDQVITFYSMRELLLKSLKDDFDPEFGNGANQIILQLFSSYFQLILFFILDWRELAG